MHSYSYVATTMFFLVLLFNDWKKFSLNIWNQNKTKQNRTGITCSLCESAQGFCVYAGTPLRLSSSSMAMPP